MARLTSEDKELILADFHTGQYTHRELAKKYKVSHVTVGKLVKGLSPKHKDKVTAQIAIATELSEESYQEVTAVTKAVEDGTKHLLFFQNSALKNQKFANAQISEDSELYDLKLHADITSKNKQSVLGRDADTQVNIQNNTQNNLEATGITVKLRKE